MLKTMIYVLLMLQSNTQGIKEATLRSVSAIERLLPTQAHLIRSLEERQQFLSEKDMKLVKTYQSRLKRDHALFVSDPEHHLGNPINAFTLIMRLTRDLTLVEKILNKTAMYKRSDSLVYPTKRDSKTAIDGIILIESMYGLNISQLANGTLISYISHNKKLYVERVNPMTANDCYVLAMAHKYPNDTIRHFAWLEEAYKRYKTDQLFCSFSEEQLIGRIGTYYYSMKNWKKTIYWIEKNLEINPDDAKLHSLLQHVRIRNEESKGRAANQNLNEKIQRIVDNSNIISLCRGESSFIFTNAREYCYYAHGPHPYLRLAPFRAELLHQGPDVTMFYDVISDAEIQAIKTYAKPLLKNSVIVEDGFTKVSDYRISQTTFLPNHMHEVVRVLNRLRQFTGLTFEESSEVSAANYGIGGYFAPHVDYVTTNSIIEYKQRIATGLLYLSNVEQGGATTFVNLNLTIFPVKNAAVFWFNLDSWGNPDNRTQHSACPVLRGSKWVLTKWINLVEQNLNSPRSMHAVRQNHRYYGVNYHASSYTK